MTLFTSTHFASTCASGTDWRDISKTVLEQLESICTGDHYFNLGFIYISDHLADDTESIIGLFKSVLKIEHWVGSVGMGVVGCNRALVDSSSISAMIGRFEKDDFHILKSMEDHDDIETGQEKTSEQWLAQNMPMLGLVHANPMAQEDPQIIIEDLANSTNSFLIGGLTSSRSHHFHIADNLSNDPISGVLFSDNVPVSTTLSQGCQPIAGFHIITKTDEDLILELDEKPALDVLQDDLRILAMNRMEEENQNFTSTLDSIENSDHIPEEFKSLFRGHIHAALPLPQSDQNDYLVRNITGLDPQEQAVMISETVDKGQRLFFVERNHDSMLADLSKTILKLRQRVRQERGTFDPKGALYVSCIARGFSEDPIQMQNEMNIIHDIIGDIPLTGFYAGGEISNARLYGYTGILTLFF